MQTLRLDLVRGQIDLGGRTVRSRGRWDVPFLACLMRRAEISANTAVGAEVLQRDLSAFGLDRPLAAVQWARIVDRLIGALNELDPTLELGRRLRYRPRNKTTGPWWWSSDPWLAFELQPPTVLPPERDTDSAPLFGSCPLMTVAVDQVGFDTLRLASRFKLAMEALWKADPLHALSLLEDGGAWDGESNAMSMLRMLRRAEALSSVGQTTAAADALAQLRGRINDPDSSALLAPHVDAAQFRISYNVDPVGRYKSIREKLLTAVASDWRAGRSRVDATALSEHLHLLSLCERRALERSEGVPNASRPPRALLPMLASAHAALFLCFLVRNYERAQHVCANLAYAHQKAAAIHDGDHWKLAVGWHGLSFAMHESFGGAESSAWEYIFLGELWLSSTQARQALAADKLVANWNCETPDTMAFYQDACRIAEQLGDPRQLAYALLNRHRFAVDQKLTSLRDESLARLSALLASRPDIKRTLVDEGYDLPRRARTRGN